MEEDNQTIRNDITEPEKLKKLVEKLKKEIDEITPKNIPSPSPYYPDGYGQRGWVCPVCGKVNSPYVTSCTCRPFGNSPYYNPYSPYIPYNAPWV